LTASSHKNGKLSSQRPIDYYFMINSVIIWSEAPFVRENNPGNESSAPHVGNSLDNMSEFGRDGMNGQDAPCGTVVVEEKQNIFIFKSENVVMNTTLMRPSKGKIQISYDEKCVLIL
jgi:hypothetical protein